MLKLRNLLPFFLLIVMSCKSTLLPIDIENNVLQYQIDLVDVVDDKIKITLEVPEILIDTINYYMPKIVPGTYQNNDFGRFVENFVALDINNKPLKVRKYGNNQWKIGNAKTLRKISYWVNDTFDTEDEHNVFSPTGSNIIVNKNFILNLYAFIGYFEKSEEIKYNVAIKYPSNMSASTSLPKKTTNTTSLNQNAYTDHYFLKRYADLVDSPIMYTIPDQETFEINDINVLLSVYSPNNKHKASKLMPQIKETIRAQKFFLEGMKVTKHYSILLYLSTSSTEDARGFGALEHHTSTLVVMPESLSKEKLKVALTDVVSHEFFHIVTPIQLHSEKIHNFDYNQPEMSQHLWLYEGTTEYFSMIFQIRQGLINKKDFYNRILEKIEASEIFNTPFSFAELSTNVLKEPYNTKYGDVYQKGALISMCIDILLREQSNGEEGILDLIKKLSSQYGSSTPFKDDELINIIEEIPEVNVANFLKEHVLKNTPIDYSYYLEKVGLIISTKEIPSSYFLYKKDLHIKGNEVTGEIIFDDESSYNSFLTNLGVQQGDILLSINDKTYSTKNIYDLFSDSNLWKNGDVMHFKIKRNNAILNLETKVITPLINKNIIIKNPSATKNQIKLFKRWIND